MNNYNYLKEIHLEISRRLEQLDFDLLWKEFKVYSFAIYNNEYICLDGEILPYNNKFLGNTTIQYEGQQIAIWNIGMDPVKDLDILTGHLVHEMFHCFQVENQESRYANDLILLMYPNSSKNYSVKFQENQVLVQAFYEEDITIKQELLESFYGYRKFRTAIINDNISFEYKVETIEGVAEYIGLKALRQLSLEKYNNEIEKVIAHLKKEEEVLDIRRISYYVGVIYFIVLEKLNIDIDRYKLNEKKTIFELFYKDVSIPNNINSFDSSNFKSMMDKETDKKRRIIEKFNTSQEIKLDGYKIIGYDPMNMFRLEDYIYCSHLVFLGKNDDHKMLQKELLLLMKKNSINEVISYKVLDDK